MQFGVVPIFCDSLDNGNISPEAIAAFITPRTKAVVVTHMWGMPCNMRAIRDILRKHPNVLLIEDCSHAHGAKIDGQFVGTFGDAAAWSLQGIDIVRGGEGGITLTKNPEIYYRQLVWGHHNKRCKAEIPSDHPLSLFSLNEVGNKHRAHPIAIALAFTDLERLDSIRQFKALYASQMVSRLASIPFLHAPSVVTTGESRIEPAWYAFILRFIGSRAPDGLSRKSFVGKLHERGLREVNIPRSTGLLHQNPLYKTPHRFFPHAYPHGLSPAFIRNVDFPAAQAFSGEAIKLPVWTSHNDQAVVNHYLDVICDVAREEIGNLNGMD